MPNAAVSVEALSKRYRIATSVARPATLAAALTALVAAPMRNLRRLRALSSFDDEDDRDVFWALRDVSFELKHGEVLGVVGRNGAGKSTLLKILSRITHPTAGRARVFGRIGSLLEVGTGFHPELTGRENVYLNGSILGMDHRYVSRIFEQIVEFAGVGRFIDTPVKRYSSGMYLRLAFAVAAYLEPDVLVVDEVLAVGDADFQQKCLRRMDETAHEGRTVLFVSHNLNAVRRLCPRAVLLQAGRIAADGNTSEVVSRYVASGGSDRAPGQWVDLSDRRNLSDDDVRLMAVRYGTAGDDTERPAHPGGALELSIRLQSPRSVQRPSIGFNLRDLYGSTLVSGSTTAKGATVILPEGASTWQFRIASLSLQPGVYQMELWVGDPVRLHDHIERAMLLEVVDSERSAGCRFDPHTDGVVYCDYEVARVNEGQEAPVRALCGSKHVARS